MNPFGLEDLARLPAANFYQAAFRKATGVALRIIAPEAARQRNSWGMPENAFCRLMTTAPLSCAACHETESRIQQSVFRRGSRQQLHCYAGLTVVAAPVCLGARHVATLLGGEVLRREPTERDFLMLMKQLGNETSSD